jgi:hypothetical protein
MNKLNKTKALGGCLCIELGGKVSNAGKMWEAKAGKRHRALADLIAVLKFNQITF